MEEEYNDDNILKEIQHRTSIYLDRDEKEVI